MTQTTTLSSQLERLLELEPALKISLSETQNAEQIVAHLTAAAARHQLPLDADALRQALDAMHQIGRLVEADPELAQDLKEAGSARQASELIQRAARRHDVQIGQAGSATRELSDAELEHASGGILLESILAGGLILGLTLGVGVAVTTTGIILSHQKQRNS